MASELPQPVDLPLTPLDLLRQRVAMWNNRLHDLAADLDRIEHTLADAIGETTENHNHRENAD